MTQTFKNLPRNTTGEHWAVIKSAFVSDADKVVGHVTKGRYKIWLAVETGRWIDECKELGALLLAASRGEHNAVLFRYSENVRDVKRSMRCDKRGRGI